MARGSREPVVPAQALTNNSIYTRHYAATTVTGADIANNNVTTAKILDNECIAGKFTANNVTQAKLTAGALPIVPTFTNQTAARAITNVYQNGGTEQLLVIFSGYDAVAAGGPAAIALTAELRVENVTPPTVVRDQATGTCVQDAGIIWQCPIKLIAFVEPNDFYSVIDTAAVAVLTEGAFAWAEYS